MSFRSFGMTLIEVLIAVLVIGVLLAIAIPSYLDYVTRSRLSEAMDMVTPVQLEVGQACLGKYLAGADNAAMGMPAASAYETAKVVKSIVATGTSATAAKIVVTLKAFGGVQDGATMVYVGECSAAGVNWQLDASSTLPTKYRPRV